MSIYNTVVEELLLPISDFVLKKTIMRHFKLLMKSEWWSESDLIEYQNEKLRNLITHAYSNVPYYRELFDERKLKPADIKGRGDLHKIPILTKEIIRKNFPHKIVDKNYSSKLIVPHKSSGSTGEPLQYYVSKDAYSFNIACNLRGWYWMGYKLGDKFIKISQYERPPQKQLQDIFLRTKYMSSAKLDEEKFRNFIKIFNKYNPKIIRCYPDPLYFIAKYMEKEGFKSPGNLECITTTGNVLLPNVRKTIEKQFNKKIYDSYRCEGGPNAFENPSHELYISSMEYGISEILSDSKEVLPGQKGKHVVTDLQNYAMPFIRYDSQDIVVKGTKKCPSGRQHLTFEKIEGRESDILITPSGKYIIVLHFVDYFDRFDSIEKFQIYQEAIDVFEFRLMTNNKYNSKVDNEIYDYWKEYLGPDVKIIIKKVDEIMLTHSGKRRLLIRNKNLNLGI